MKYNLIGVKKGVFSHHFVTSVLLAPSDRAAKAKFKRLVKYSLERGHWREWINVYLDRVMRKGGNRVIASLR